MRRNKDNKIGTDVGKCFLGWLKIETVDGNVESMFFTYSINVLFHLDILPFGGIYIVSSLFYAESVVSNVYADSVIIWSEKDIMYMVMLS